MSKITTEKTFETAIIQSLIENGGYTAGNVADYSTEPGMFKYDALKFLQVSQPSIFLPFGTYHFHFR